MSAPDYVIIDGQRHPVPYHPDQSFHVRAQAVKAAVAAQRVAPASYVQHFADSVPQRYATDLVARGAQVWTADGKRQVATVTTPGWAVQIAAAWNAETAQARLAQHVLDLILG